MNAAKFIRLAWLNLRYLPYFVSDRIFDRYYGVKTGVPFKGREDISSFTLVGNAKSGNPYQETPYGTARRVFAALPSAKNIYTFVDFGSGRGRMLALASRYGFKKIIGVEFAKDLHEDAIKNLAGIDNAVPILRDAGTFHIPAGPLVLYFFNPFKVEVMERVVSNIVASYRERPRHIVVAVLNETVTEAFEKTGIFESTKFVREDWLSGLSHPRRYVVKILEASGARLKTQKDRAHL